MNLHYKIVEVWPSDHLIVVRYWTDIISEESLASNDIRKEDGSPERCRSDVSLTLPIPMPDEKELEELILLQAPKEWLKTLENVADPNVDTSMSSIMDLYGKVKTKEVSFDKNNNVNILSDDEIQSLIQKFNQEKK